MTLRKFFDNSVRYVNKKNHSHKKQALPVSKERDSKPNLRKKNASINKLSQKNTKLVKNRTGEGFRIIK